MRRIGLLCCFILCGSLTAHCVVGQEKSGGGTGDEISKLIGDWSGESVCTDKEKVPACNDEQVVYHVVATSGKSDTVTITADKIVNGKRVTMGAFDFVYDVQKQTLTSEVKNSKGNIIFELAVKGDTLEGTLSTLPDKAIVRRIKVKKNERTDGAT
jgi:hypothetical protein